jgi:uncharacterized protein YrrD
LRTFTLLKGLPIFVKDKGLKIGEVSDISISKNGAVKGLLLKKGALIKKTFIVPIGQVSSFGKDGVMINDVSVLQEFRDSRDFTFESQQRINGKPLLSSRGEKLGFLDDVYFQEELGTIVGYECSDGFFSDITEGKQVVKTDEPPTIGKDAIIVKVKEGE